MVERSVAVDVKEPEGFNNVFSLCLSQQVLYLDAGMGEGHKRERERGVMKKQVDSIHKELAWPSCIFFTCTLLKVCIAILYSQQGISLFLSSFLRLGRILLLAHGYDISILCLTMGIGFAPFSFLVNHQSPGTNEHCWARAGLSVTAGD